MASEPSRKGQASGARFRPRPLAFAICTVLAFLPGAGKSADIFDALSGTFEAPFSGGLDCNENPHTVRFSADRTKATFRWQHEMTDYLGLPRIEGEYEVLAHDADSVTMRITDEQRTTADGTPVVWIMRRLTDPEGYCWGRTDWPADACGDEHLRCPSPPPLS